MKKSKRIKALEHEVALLREQVRELQSRPLPSPVVIREVQSDPVPWWWGQVICTETGTDLRFQNDVVPTVAEFTVASNW